MTKPWWISPGPVTRWIFWRSTSGSDVGTCSLWSKPRGCSLGLAWVRAGAPRTAGGRRAQSPPGRPSRQAHGSSSRLSG
eukprot:1303826-Alexandrium_andersonii.AAC.1